MSPFIAIESYSVVGSWVVGLAALLALLFATFLHLELCIVVN